MKDLHLYYEIKEAWETSTPSDNRFFKKLRSIDWDKCFPIDDEYYFILGDFILTTPTLDPFGKHKWNPSVKTSDGSTLDF